jgi:2-polyprenyl-6-methoxyphenol hydroxylase-like FAD-dependent oxidoreductase
VNEPLTIVGGGIGGLSSAIALAQSGRSIHLLEQAKEIRAIGYGIQLGPNAFHALEQLGIEDAVLRKCSLPDEGLLRDARTSEVLLRLPMGAKIQALYGKPYAVIHRADLHQILTDRCDHLGVDVTTDCKLLSFHDDGSAVRLETTKGGMTAPALIAADGVFSKVRSTLIGTCEPKKLGYAAFRAVRPMQDLPSKFAGNAVMLWCGEGYHMIHYPLRNGTLFNVVAAFDYSLDEGPEHAGRSLADRLINRFSGACGEVRELLNYVDLSQHWEIATIEPLGEWSKGRVALLGDSAHAMVQAMAQGACQAIEDGLVLVDSLEKTDDQYEDAFKIYQAKRILRATRVQYMSRFVWELIHVRGGLSLLRRDLLAQFRDSDVLEKLSWLYDAGHMPAQRGDARYEPALTTIPRTVEIASELV